MARSTELTLEFTNGFYTFQRIRDMIVIQTGQYRFIAQTTELLGALKTLGDRAA